MSVFRVPVTATDTATPFLEELRDALEDKTPLHAEISVFAKRATEDYLRGLDLLPSRHATADRLGAKRTGHFAKAAKAVSASYDSTAAIVKIAHPGFSRAFGPVTIRPKRRKALTIPVHPEAYGKSAREFDDLFMIRYDGASGKTIGKLARRVPGSDIAETLYILVKSAHQEQDRRLLPPEERYAVAAELAAREIIKRAEAAPATTTDV